MKLINAMLTHAWLAFSLKHDGTGLPTKIPAALVLISLYVGFTLANKHADGGIDLNTILGLSFIAQFYMFGLRNSLVGLIILISTVINGLTFILHTLGGIAFEQLAILMVLEYIMIFAGVINLIKRNYSVTKL